MGLPTYTRDSLVGSTEDGHWFYLAHFMLLLLVMPVFWEPRLSFWISLYDATWKKAQEEATVQRKGFIGRNAVFLSKWIAFLGSAAFLVARIGYLFTSSRHSASDNYAYESANVIVTIVACGTVILVSLARILWNVCSCTRGPNLDGGCIARLTSDEDVKGENLGLLRTAVWIARFLLLVALGLDVADRNGSIAHGLGITGVVVCAVSVLDGLWYTAVQSGCNPVAPRELPSATDDARGDVVDPFRRARLFQRAISWTIGCCLVAPVQFLRPGHSY